MLGYQDVDVENIDDCQERSNEIMDIKREALSVLINKAFRLMPQNAIDYSITCPEAKNDHVEYQSNYEHDYFGPTDSHLC